MNIIAVDDERAALWSLERAIKSAAPHADIACFETPREALEYAKKQTVDIAFLDIQMGGMNGLALAKELKDIYGKTNIIFVTAYDAYMGSAFDLRASGYVVKPIEAQDVADELENLRNPLPLSDEGIRIQCFGNFAVFAHGKPVIFGRPKARELLAYLIDRKGAGVSKKALAAVLWEEEAYTRSRQVHLHKLFAEIERAFAEAGAENILTGKRGVYSVDMTKFSCDFYDYENGIASAVNTYRGEYMAEYSWAEFTAGFLNDKP